MKFKNDLIERYQEIVCKQFIDVNREVIERTILEILIELKDDYIDNNSIIQSSSANDDLEIRLLPISNDYLAVYISIFDLNIVDIQIGNEGVEYLYLQEIRDWNGIKKLKETLLDLFHNEIIHEIHISNGKIKKAFYIIPYEDENNIKKLNTIGKVIGTSWFWEKTVVQKNIYKPWLG